MEDSLGNADAEDVMEGLQDWLRWMASPKRIHVDADGIFTSGKLADFCSRRGIRVIVVGGEAHWQLGVVERHIGTLKDALAKLYLEYCNGDLSPQQFVDFALEAKNQNFSHNGFSPANWMNGRSLPLIQSETVPPNSTGFSDFELHLARKCKAA